MDQQRENEPHDSHDRDTGEVPDKQLHRWKGEGGALPPEPGFKDDSESEPKPRPDE